MGLHRLCAGSSAQRGQSWSTEAKCVVIRSRSARPVRVALEFQRVSILQKVSFSRLIRHDRSLPASFIAVRIVRLPAAGCLPSMNLADELGKQAQARPDAVAVCLPSGTLGFRQLDGLVWQVAGFLHRNRDHLGPSRIVALSFANELTLLVTLLAVARIGATAFSLPGHASPLLRAEMAKRAGAGLLLTDARKGDAAGLPRLHVDIDDALARNDGNAPIDAGDIRAAAPRAPWLIIAGSGSTGRSKFFAVTHAQFLFRVRLAGRMLDLSPADRLATLIHLDFTSTKDRYLAALFAGAAVVLFDRERTHPLGLCRDRDVTVLHATVFHVEQLLAALPADAVDQLAGLRALQLSASTVSYGLRQRVVKKLTPALHVLYGSNETGPLSCVGPAEVLGASGTVGRPGEGVRIDIVAPDGQPVPAGQVGLIRASSPGMVDGYLDDAESTAQSFRNGYFFPGDLGCFAPNGHLIFKGRSDHLMIMNGINIYPAEIEQAVSLHPAVRDVAVMPLHSRLHQDVPVCAVVLQPGASVTEMELLAFARQRLGSHAPVHLVRLDGIPHNAQGKLVRALLEKAIIEKLQRKTGQAAAQHLPTFPEASAACAIRPEQPVQWVRLRFRHREAVDLARLDDWFVSALEIPGEPCNSPQPLPWAGEHAPIAQMAWRMLLLYRMLLQESGIPVFHPGCVLGIERAQGTAWIVTVALAHIEHIPPRCHALASTEAVRFVVWMLDHPRTPEHAAMLFETMWKRVLKPVRQMVVAGKSTLPVLRAAYALDIPFCHLGAGVYQLGWGKRAVQVDRSTTVRDSAIGSKLAQNKVWSANLIRMAGFPAPQHEVVATPEEAGRAARNLGWPVVVKPLDRERGEGVTVGIADEHALAAAFKLAKSLSRARQVIVERQVAGVCHRVFIADGRLLYAVKRLPKSIHGDGQSTLAELLQAANRREEARPPWRRTEPYPMDALAEASIAAAGYAFDAIPAAGERISLRPIESTAWGGYDEDVTGQLHPDNLDIALRVSALFGLQVAGVDIISADIRLPWHANGAIINEVNFAPLLGGGEISRSHIPAFLARLVEDGGGGCGRGRIPIEVIVGDDAAMEAARIRQAALLDQQIHAVASSHETTLLATGEAIHFPFDSLYRRCKALLLDKRVEAILLVVQTDELLDTGLPVDRIDRLTVAAPGGKLKRSRHPDGMARLQALLRALSARRTQRTTY